MSQVCAGTPLAYRDGYIDVHCLRLHYVDYGGAGEVVVALHGLLQSAHAFDAIAPLLAQRFRLLALDLRGRGESAWGPPERYTWTQYLADLQGFLAALGLSRVALIGSSLGGGLALMQSIVHPERVTRLVLNDSVLDPNIAGLLRWAERTAHAPADFASMDEATAWFLAHRVGLRRLDAETLRVWVGQYLTTTATGTLRFRCDPAIMASMVDRHMPRPPGRMAWEMLRRLTMPVLILRGALSDVALPESAARAARLLPAVRCVEIPGVGHSPTLYEPEAQAALRDFFSI